jgi:D-tagatose 6-phosphate 4-epimerase
MPTTPSPSSQLLRLPAAMEALMLEEPGDWRKYYNGNESELGIQRHFSFSDRIGYYWPHPKAQTAVDELFAGLGDAPISGPLTGQYLGALYADVSEGLLPATPRALAIGAVQRVLRRYDSASEAC